MAGNKIGIGIIGASPDRGWARAAHVPALQALSNYEIRAVSTTRRATAERSAEALGALLAFDNHHELVTRPEVDLVVIAVNVTRHHELATAALAAGKMVYCEWPLGRNLAEAEEIAALARTQGLRTIIGLQGRFAPAVQHLRRLVAEGTIGRVLGTRIAGVGPDDLWAGILAPEFEITADPASGNTLLAIPVGHALDMLAFVLGEFVSVSATLIAGRGQARRLRDGATIPFSMHDQIAFSGVLASGGLASVHYYGGAAAGPVFIWEINGTDGHIRLTADKGYANIAELKLEATQGKGRLETLVPPNEHHLAPRGLPVYAGNVARLYAQFVHDLAEGTAVAPDFDVAVRRHRLLDAIERSNALGIRQAV
jgi:predicted dehydrogenase